MTVYMNWKKNTLALMLRKKRLKKKSNKRANKKYFSHVPVSAMSSFNLIKEFKLVRKKYEKIKMVSMSVFKIKQMCQLPS